MRRKCTTWSVMTDLLNIYKQILNLTLTPVVVTHAEHHEAPHWLNVRQERRCLPAGGLTAGLFPHFLPAATTWYGGLEVPAAGCVKVQTCTCLFTNIKNTSKTASRPIWVHEWGSMHHRSPDDWKVGMNQCLWKHHTHVCSKCVELLKDFFLNVSMQIKSNQSNHEDKPLYYPFSPHVIAPPTALESEIEWNRDHLHRLNRYNLLNKSQTAKKPTAVLTQDQSHKWRTDTK